jgi:hypothetical protein
MIYDKNARLVFEEFSGILILFFLIWFCFLLDFFEEFVSDFRGFLILSFLIWLCFLLDLIEEFVSDFRDFLIGGDSSIKLKKNNKVKLCWRSEKHD